MIRPSARDGLIPPPPRPKKRHDNDVERLIGRDTMKRSATIVAGVLGLWLVPVQAEDVPESRDHAMISRYDGSEIIRYAEADFDEYALLVERATAYGGKSQNLHATLALEGRTTRITYVAPDRRTTLDVFRNYRGALEPAGFEILFECSNDACGGRDFNHAVVEYTGEFGDYYEDQRYLAARLSRDGGDVYVSLYVSGHVTEGGAGIFKTYTQLDVIEVAGLAGGLVTVDANAMADALDAEGHIALYNIYFDTGKYDLKPESEPALIEIARLLEGDPGLELLIVGHTDNVGELAYNDQLSLRRAQAVVGALRTAHGADASRLVARGVGMYAPVAENVTDAGRAKNRRVELVKR
jgi:outer membrane protein OmpA-like peptidoglycan-associated protein